MYKIAKNKKPGTGFWPITPFIFWHWTFVGILQYGHTRVNSVSYQENAKSKQSEMKRLWLTYHTCLDFEHNCTTKFQTNVHLLANMLAPFHHSVHLYGINPLFCIKAYKLFTVDRIKSNVFVDIHSISLIVFSFEARIYMSINNAHVIDINN